jgi:lysine 2,3-aminomutase
VSLPLAAAAREIRRDRVGDGDWLDWRWQLRNMLRGAADLESVIELSEGERRGLARSAGMFRTGLTPYYADLMDRRDPSCPIRRQAIPSEAELDVAPGEQVDPLGEDSHNPAPRVFHKYPDRCLLMVIDRCAIYCRHCNRRRIVGGDAPPTGSELEAGIDYIRRETRIRDVLLSGGDPLLLSTARLERIVSELRSIDHVEIIRIGTRVPVVLPMRIDRELAAMLARYHPLYINTHFNHPVELTGEAARACAILADAGIPLANQAVLLRGINSSVRCLRALMRGLLRTRVRPYYLFIGDTVVGTDHLRTRVEDAIELYDGLRGWMSGMAVPHLVIDAPGGGGKIPVLPDYLMSVGEREVELRNYRGEPVSYPQPRAGDLRCDYDEVYFAGVAPDDDREGSR